MKASLRSARIAPKKANILARMVRGMTVAEAQEALQHTNKKAARMIEKLLNSAVANATHNDKQDADKLIISSIVVNQGTAYRRGMPKARGQTRPFRKFLSHVSLELGYPSDGTPKTPKKPRKPTKEAGASASQKAKSSVQRKGKKNTASSDSSDSSASSASSK